MGQAKWAKLGKAEAFKTSELQALEIEGVKIALSFRDGKFGAISGNCLHFGGPLGKGTLSEQDYVVCPWHSWQFHRMTGEARPGIPAAVPKFEVKEENGELFINLNALTQAKHAHHPAHPLSREIKRAEGPLRVAGISTTVMNQDFPRYSTSEELLKVSMEHAASKHGAETKLIRLNDLKFRACEGYYSKNEKACTWPCTITQMDPKDELSVVYDVFVHWADIVIVSTPIRWGNASSLYYKMTERMNAIQNQMTVAGKSLIRDKTAAFIITGGQDNIQAVAGQMLTFFGELGFAFPKFPFIAHSRGWSAEDMENNVAFVQQSEKLRESACELVNRAVENANQLVFKK